MLVFFSGLVIGCNDEDEGYGELIIENMVIYTNFPEKPNPVFTNSKYKDLEITYTIYDEGDYIVFEDGYFIATDDYEVEVEATTKYHTTSFIVEARVYQDMNQSFYLNRVKENEQKWKNAGSPTGGTVFIGDSFFDTEFWSNFYTTYTDGNTFANGVSSSTIKDWKLFANRLLYPLNPENIVIHLGTNDFYDDKDDSDTVLSNLIELIENIHNRLPDAKIYYFAIEPRTCAIANYDNPFTKTDYDILTNFNYNKVSSAITNYAPEFITTVGEKFVIDKEDDVLVISSKILFNDV